MKNRALFQTILSMVAGLSLTVFLTGCSVNYLVNPLNLTDKFRDLDSNVLNSGKLSSQTVQELRITARSESFLEDPEGTLATMEAEPVAGRET